MQTHQEHGPGPLSVFVAPIEFTLLLCPWARHYQPTLSVYECFSVIVVKCGDCCGHYDHYISISLQHSKKLKAL